MKSPVTSRTAGTIVCLLWSVFSFFPAVPAHGRDGDFSDHQKKLKSKKASVRSQSAEALVRADREAGAAAVLVALRNEKNKAARLDMISALGESGRREVADELRELLKDADKDVKLQAACALARSGNADGLRELESVALDTAEDRGRRSSAVRSLGEIRSDASVDILGRILIDEDFALRLQAVASLGRIGTKRALDLIAGMRDDPDEGVRTLSAGILRKGTSR